MYLIFKRNGRKFKTKHLLKETLYTQYKKIIDLLISDGWLISKVGKNKITLSLGKEKVKIKAIF